MHNILCLNKISPLGTDRLGENYTYACLLYTSPSPRD